MQSKTEKRERRRARRQARREMQKEAERVWLAANPVEEEPEPELEILGSVHVCGYCGRHFWVWSLIQDWDDHMVACRKRGFGTTISDEVRAANAIRNEREVAAAKGKKNRARRIRRKRRRARYSLAWKQRIAAVGAEK